MLTFPTSIMPRSHPPTLLRLAERTLREECGVKKGERLLVAVSGGPDSNALLHVLSMLGDKVGFFVHAHGVDHGLRAEAAAELDYAQKLARDCQVPFTRSLLQVAAGGNLQARARAARLEALRAEANKRACRWVATAHHADDRAETVLIRLLQGSGPSGLAVLPPVAGDLVRPLIRARRSDVLRHLERHRIDFCLDPSNENRRFLRVRVRLELLPLLESLSVRIVDHLNALADQLAQGPPPRLLDVAGRPVALKRAHLDQIRHALRSGSASVVPLSAGRAVHVDPGTGALRLLNGAPEPFRARGKSNILRSARPHRESIAEHRSFRDAKSSKRG